MVNAAQERYIIINKIKLSNSTFFSFIIVLFLKDDVLVVGTNSVFASDVDVIFEDKGILFGNHLDKSSEYIISLGFGVFLIFLLRFVIDLWASLFFLFNF